MMLFLKDENGQGMLEYVLIIALVALVLVTVLVLLNSKSSQITNAAKERLDSFPTQ